MIEKYQNFLIKSTKILGKFIFEVCSMFIVRSDVSRASSRGSDETIQTASVSYSNDFGSDKSSYSESPSQGDSPPIVASHSTISNGVARRILESTDSSIPTGKSVYSLC